MLTIDETNMLWGLDRLAREVGLLTMTLYRRLEAGHVPGARKIAGRWVISRADLDAYKAVVPADMRRKRAA